MREPGVDTIELRAATPIAPAHHTHQRVASLQSWSPGHQGPSMVAIAVVHTSLLETFKQININYNQLVFLQ